MAGRSRRQRPDRWTPIGYNCCMPPTFVIDGYNLLHRGYPALLGEGDLAEARERLERKLQAFHALWEPGARIVLVYDGASGIVGGPRRESSLEILFSRPPQQADDVILDLCRRLEGRRDVQVVTSDDSDIGGRIQGLVCGCWSSERFRRLVERRLAQSGGERPGRSGVDTEKPPGLSDEQVDDWLREFDMQPDDPEE